MDWWKAILHTATLTARSSSSRDPTLQQTFQWRLTLSTRLVLLEASWVTAALQIGRQPASAVRVDTY